MPLIAYFQGSGTLLEERRAFITVAQSDSCISAPQLSFLQIPLSFNYNALYIPHYLLRWNGRWTHRHTNTPHNIALPHSLTRNTNIKYALCFLTFSNSARMQITNGLYFAYSQQNKKKTLFYFRFVHFSPALKI